MNYKIIDEIKLILAQPETTVVKWIGMPDYRDEVLACWTLLHADDLPMVPRILGKPGVGKTSLALACAEYYQRPAYVFQCTMDTRPEDLLISPFLNQDNRISYFASPIVTAMLEGGVAILDEANRMTEKSWASLAPLLDYRQSVESVITGLKIKAHPDFRCCVTMNEDASTYEIPDYILSRLQPRISLDFPNEADEKKILSYHLRFAPEKLIDLAVRYLQTSHRLNLDFASRDGIHLIQYTLRLMKLKPDLTVEQAFVESIRRILGDEATDPDSLSKKRNLDIPKTQFEFSDWHKNSQDYSDGFQSLNDFLSPADSDLPDNS
ncbi:MAG: AAA family ATPase [Candidatus Delongbacteria bacterium]|nr:AAA family ATPase [Candidatus Delongbacteria bacterium]